MKRPDVSMARGGSIPNPRHKPGGCNGGAPAGPLAKMVRVLPHTSCARATHKAWECYKTLMARKPKLGTEARRQDNVSDEFQEDVVIAADWPEAMFSLVDSAKPGPIVLIGLPSSAAPTIDLELLERRLVELDRARLPGSGGLVSSTDYEPLPFNPKDYLNEPAAAIVWRGHEELSEDIAVRFLKAILPLLSSGAPLIYGGVSRTPIPSHILEMQHRRVVRGSLPRGLFPAEGISYVGVYRPTEVFLRKFEIDRAAELLWGEPQRDEGYIFRDTVPEILPATFPKRRSGRPKAEDSDFLLKFLRTHYGAYLPTKTARLRTYIYEHDKQLYTALQSFERRKPLPNDLRMASERTVSQDRLKKAFAEGGLGNFPKREKRLVTKSIARRLISKPD